MAEHYLMGNSKVVKGVVVRAATLQFFYSFITLDLQQGEYESGRKFIGLGPGVSL